ncbi:MAG: O-antigen polymerase [bacterium]
MSEAGQIGTSSGTVSYGHTSLLVARQVQLPVLVAVILGSAYMAATLIGFLVTADPRLLLVCAAVGPVLILLAPQLFQRSYDLLAPLHFIALSAMFGVTLRSLYVVVVDDRTTRELLLQGEPPEFLIPAVLLINAALACLVLGYLAPWPRIQLYRGRLPRRRGWSDRRVKVVAALLVAVGGACVALYLDRLDIQLGNLARLSAKRRLEVTGGEYGYAAMGYCLWGMSLLSYAFYLLWSQLVFSGRRLISLSGVTTLAVGLLAAFPPFLTSSRTGVMVLVIYAAIIWNYARRPLTARWLTGAVVAGLLVVTAMAGLRGLGGRMEPGSTSLDAMAVPEAVLGNRNWLGVTKTAHLMEAVPDEIDYQKGKSFLTWLVAPIPRTVWPEKPVIRVGVTLGEDVFEKGRRTSGVPPGFIGELYLNFGYLGVFGGMLALGMVLRMLYASFWPLLGSNPSALLLYTVLVFPLTLSLVSNDFSGVVINIARSLITLGVLLPLVRERATPQPTDFGADAEWPGVSKAAADP